MTPTPPVAEPVSSAARPGVTAELVRGLQQGHSDSWRRLLTEQHAVFERAVRIAARRTGGAAFAVSRDAQVVDDAKVYFYEAFRRGYRDFVGEGQFFGFLYRTVLNFVREATRGVRRSGVPESASAGEQSESTPGAGRLERRAVALWQEGQRGLDATLEGRLQQCLMRLPDPYRAVVVMHHFERESQPLQSLAAVFELTVAAIHKRYQRAIALLRECLAVARSDHDVE